MSKSNRLIAANMYARYSGIISLSDLPLLLVDTSGDILLEFQPSPDFCKYICQDRKNQVCPDYISRFNSKRAERFTCKYGLENILLPIMHNDEIVGYVSGIQAYSNEMEYQKFMIGVPELLEKNGLELQDLAKIISALKVAEKSKIEIHEHLCGHIANNISIDLSESINATNTDVARLSIEKDILEKKIIDLEAKNMSLAINPHFLFNTLNSIARIAYFEKSHATEELIYCLSDLLRYNLKQKDNLHTIEAEIDIIEKYLYIQKARFKNRLEYVIDIAERIKPFRIPTMILQPIVENAVIHGITSKRDGGRVDIYAEKYKNDINISIADNGNGFPASVVEDMRKSGHESGVGLLNTDRRLKQYFGNQYGLKITKSDYSGSTVVVSISTNPSRR